MCSSRTGPCRRFTDLTPPGPGNLVTAWCSLSKSENGRRGRKSAGVLLDRHAVVHLVHAHDLRLTAVTAELVVLAHDQRLDRFGRTDLGAQPAKAAAR